MLTCQKIFEKPHLLPGLIGMSLPEFEKLYSEFELVYKSHLNAVEYTRRHKTKRRRAAGAGRKFKYSLCDRLLMTLFWLRAYTTYQVFGTLYAVNKTTVEENLKMILQTLEQLAGYQFEHPQADIPKLRSMDELLNTFPDVRLLLDLEKHSVEQPSQIDDFIC